MRLLRYGAGGAGTLFPMYIDMFLHQVSPRNKSTKYFRCLREGSSISEKDTKTVARARESAKNKKSR